VVTGLASGGLYQFRVIGVSALGDSRPSEPSLLVRTPLDLTEAAGQSLLSAHLAERGLGGESVTASELRALGAIGAADARALQADAAAAGGGKREARLAVPAAQDGAAEASAAVAGLDGGDGEAAGASRGRVGPGGTVPRGSRSAEGTGGVMARPRAEDTGKASGGDTPEVPPGGRGQWGEGPAVRTRRLAAEAKEARAEAKEAQRRAVARRAALREALPGANGAAASAFGDAGARASAVRVRSMRIGRTGRDGDDGEGPGGAVSVGSSGLGSDDEGGGGDSREGGSVDGAAPTPRGAEDPVADRVDVRARAAAERDAVSRGASSLLRAMPPTAVGWAGEAYVMGPGGGSTEMELRQQARVAPAVVTAERGREEYAGPRLGDDLRSIGVTEDTAAAALAASSAEEARGTAVGEVTPGAAEKWSDDGRLPRAARPIPAPAEWTPQPSPGAGGRAGMLRPADPTAGAAPRTGGVGHTILADLPSDASPREEGGADAHAMPGTDGVGAGLSAGAAGTPGQSRSRAEAGGRLPDRLWARGIDPTCEAFQRSRPTGEPVHRMGLASAFECYRYLLPPEDPDSLAPAWGGGGGDGGWDGHGTDGSDGGGRGDGGDDDAWSFEPDPPSTHRAVDGSEGRAAGGSEGSRAGSPVPDPPMPAEEAGRRPTASSGLPHGVTQAARMAPAEHRRQTHRDARLAAFIHSDATWEPQLGRGEPAMTVLCPLGTPGGDGIDDRSCVPAEGFGATAAGRMAAADRRRDRGDGASDGSGEGKGGSDSEDDETDDVPVTVACVDFLFYSKAGLLLEGLGRLPSALLPDEVPDPMSTLEADDADVMPNSGRGSNHVGLVAEFSVIAGVAPLGLHAGYRD